MNKIYISVAIIGQSWQQDAPFNHFNMVGGVWQWWN
nr:MAG TPA: hypothetical protein [Caudoviricetes sp.]